MNQPENSTDRNLRRLIQEVRLQEQGNAKPYDEFVLPTRSHQDNHSVWAMSAFVALLVAVGAYLLVPPSMSARQARLGVDFDELFELVDQEFESRRMAEVNENFDQLFFSSMTDGLLTISFEFRGNRESKTP